MTGNTANGMAAALRDWGTARFATSLQQAIEALGSDCLPLAAGTREGGHVTDEGLAVSVIEAADRGACIAVRIGVFFTEVVGGCSCGDDPYTLPGYCQLQVTIDKQTCRAGFAFIDEAAPRHA